MKLTLRRASAGIAIGTAAWFSFGVLALTSDPGRWPIGLLPPWWWLIVFVSAGVLVAGRLTRVSSALLMMPALTILPWFGVRSPAALMWSGPLVLLLWALVAVGVAVAYAPTRVRFPPRVWAVALVAGAVLSTFAAGVSRSSITGDAPHYLLISQSLWRDGDLDLANDYDLSRHERFYAGVLKPHHTVVAPSGREYSFHGSGVGVLVLPAFAAAGLTGARALLVLISALGVAAVWRAIRELTEDTTAAWAGASVLVLQLPFLAQSSAVFPDGPAAAITAFALLSLVRLEKGAALSAAHLSLAGAALAVLPWLHVRLAYLAVVFGGALVVGVWRRSASLTSLAALVAVPIVLAALLVASAYVMFGTLDPTAALRQHTTGSLRTAPAGAFGLVADIEYGLLPYAPALICGIAGLSRFVRRHRLTGLTTVGAVLGMWLAAGSFGWWGGTSSPARFLVPVLPAMALWFGVWWPTAGVLARMTAGAGMVISAVLAMFAAFADGGMYITTDPDGRFTIFEWASRLVLVPDTLPSLFRAGRRVPDELVIAGLWTLSAAVVVRGASRVGRTIGAHTWTVSAWAVVAWIALGSSVAWAYRGTPAATVDRSQLTLLQRSARPWLETAWRNGRPASIDEVLRGLAFEAPGERDPLFALYVPYPPAGRYAIVSDAPALNGVAGVLSVEAGRDGTALWSWPLSAPEQAPAFTTVMPVHSLRVIRSNAAPEAIAPVRLKALGRDGVASEASDLVAAQVIRQESVLVYLVDAALSIETGGFWLAGDRRTRVVVAGLDGAPSGATLRFEANNAPVDIRLTRASWQQAVSIAPRAVANVELPGTSRAEVIELAVIGGERQRPAVFVSARPLSASP